MPVLGLSQNKFKIGQQHNFQVFGDNLNNCDVTAMTTNVPNLSWQNITTPGKGQKHVNVQATLTSTSPSTGPMVRNTDSIGDLTITVTDAGTAQTTTTFSPVTYQS